MASMPTINDVVQASDINSQFSRGFMGPQKLVRAALAWRDKYQADYLARRVPEAFKEDLEFYK
jgi:hypothetical protein